MFKHLPSAIAPRAYLYTGEWMAIDYLPGETKAALPSSSELAALLYDLHRQSCFGWRIMLLPLLEGYWHAARGRRTPFWLRRLKRLRQQGEPTPLRWRRYIWMCMRAIWFMVRKGVRLIDWEYAGDGDIALELAAVWMDNDAQRRALVDDYARRSAIAPAQLWRQVRRWRPSQVLMLMAGWYECRWQQTGEQQFITLANEVWRQLQTEG